MTARRGNEMPSSGGELSRKTEELVMQNSVRKMKIYGAEIGRCRKARAAGSPA